MAYMTPIEKPNCARCGAKATHYVFNRVNARNGAFCTRHAKQYVAELDARERGS